MQRFGWICCTSFNETDIVGDMDNGRVLDFQGWNRVTYLDVGSDGDCFTIGMRISGCRNARIEMPWSYFRTRTGTILFLVYLTILTGQHIVRLRKGGWQLKYSWAIFRTQALVKLPTTTGSEPFGLTPLVFIAYQCSLLMRCDYHSLSWRDFNQIVLQVRYHCTSYNCAPLKPNGGKDWIGAELTSTGRICNPGKYFFLQLVTEVVYELNSRTIGNLALARKAVIMCRLIPGENERWKLSHLTP